MTDQWLLHLLIVIPLVFAALVVVRPAEHARGIALVGTLAALVACVVALTRFDWDNAAGFQFAHSTSWIDQLGVSLNVGVDSVALLLVALTVLLGPICVGASWTAITHRLKTYYTWLLVLQAAMTGVFCARDVVFFYICFEFTLVPMYILINLYGSTNRRAAATKFFLYTFTGSIITLAGLVYVAWYHAHYVGSWTFDIATLERSARLMPASTQAWVLGALLCGFAVKVPLFPLHTWLPLAHTEAPTAGSVILAGVLLKLGTYGIYRFVLPFVPDAVAAYAPAIAVLCIIGILYAGLVCWVQTDVKKLVAYSSVSHLGFCVLGLVALNTTGLTGGVLYMLNHGLSTGALFLMIGMIYERYHTRSMNELGGLAAKMPIWGTFMMFFALASVGLPGLNGFVSEFLCTFGAFQADSSWAAAAGTSMPGATPGVLGPWFAAVAGAGVIVTAIYILFMVGKVCFGPLVEPHGHEDGHGPLPVDLTRREIAVLLPIAVGCLFFGLYPRPLIDAVNDPVRQTVAIYEDGVLPAVAEADVAPVDELHDAHGTSAGHEGDEP